MRVDVFPKRSLAAWLVGVAAVAVFLSAFVFSTFSARPVSAQAACGPNVSVVVARGQTLFRIARAYGTTVSALRLANNISNVNLIYVGQRLVVPCAGQIVSGGSAGGSVQPTLVTGGGGPTVNVLVPPPTSAPVVVQQGGGTTTVNCVGFRATSPLDGLAFGENVFYWDGAPGATGYRVNVYNEGGGIVASGEVGPNTTRIQLEIGGGAGNGFRFSWEVQALVSSFPVCTTPRRSMLRAAAPNALPTEVPTAVPLLP